MSIETGGPGTLAQIDAGRDYGGHIALIGVLAGLQGETNPHPIMRKGASMHGIFVGSRAMFERLNVGSTSTVCILIIDRTSHSRTRSTPTATRKARRCSARS